MENLNKVFIRAEVDGKWQSLSLEELYVMGQGGQVFEWGLGKLNGLEGVTITRENLSAFVDLLESFGAGIVKLK